jgi:hypothetical protein
MRFNSQDYGSEVARILALDGGGERRMPLVAVGCANEEARTLLKSAGPKKLFPHQQQAKDAMAGLWLYFSCLDEAHELAQESDSTEGRLWHAILHRQEPDDGNSAFWYRKAGTHPIFKDLAIEAIQILKKHPDAEFRAGGKWDPYAFVMFCGRARSQPGSKSAAAALEIQLVEWQLLFDFCARPK